MWKHLSGFPTFTRALGVLFVVSIMTGQRARRGSAIQPRPRQPYDRASASVGASFIASQDGVLQRTSSILQLFCNEPLLLAYLSVM